MPFDLHFFIDRAMVLIPLILSLSVHEWAHAWAAWRLGDDTARMMGRMTLDPLAHIDPIGTVLLPLLGIPFGWAKPVPINPVRFRGVTMSTGIMLTAAAGPISNVVLAIISVLLLLPLSYASGAGLPGCEPFVALLRMMVAINIALAAFNMLPIPPLDGSRIVDGLLPSRYQATWKVLGPATSITAIVFIIAGVLLMHGILPSPVQMFGDDGVASANEMPKKIVQPI